MKKLLFPVLFLMFCTSMVSQIEDNQYLYEHLNKEIDSLITAKLEQQKSNNSLLDNINLKDSTYRRIYEPIGCEEFKKYYYQYDNFGRIIELIINDNQEQGCEYVDRKISFTYDGLNVIEKLYFKHIPEVEGWLSFLKYDYIYNENDQLIDEKQYLWDEMINEWIPLYHYTYDFDANSNILEQLHYRWDENNNDWRAFYKLVYVYDLNENVIQDELYRRDQSEQQYEWNDIEINNYIYDTNNFLIENLYKSSWNNLTEDWEFLINTTFINNSIGSPHEILTVKWDFNIETWENYKYFTKEYNTNNNVLEQLYMIWDAGAWLNNNKTIYIYSTSFKLTERINQYWNSTNEEWVNDYRETRDYNEYDLIIERLYQTWYGSGNSWFTDNTAIYEYDINLNLIYESSISFTGHGGYSNHYYSEHDISLNNNENEFQNSISIVPNPTNDLFSINGLDNSAQILLFDIGGKLVLDTNTNEIIDISNYQKGVYFVKIISGESVAVKKLIKN